MRPPPSVTASIDLPGKITCVYTGKHTHIHITLVPRKATDI